jgi:hypothetical protein
MYNRPKVFKLGSDDLNKVLTELINVVVVDLESRSKQAPDLKALVDKLDEVPLTEAEIISLEGA